jgi:hypothetical protein
VNTSLHNDDCPAKGRAKLKEALDFMVARGHQQMLQWICDHIAGMEEYGYEEQIRQIRVEVQQRLAAQRQLEEEE